MPNLAALYEEMMRRMLRGEVDSEDITNFAETVSSFPSGSRLFPKADAEDIRNGATWIPGSVTDARRAGLVITFNQEGTDRTKWFWEFPNGTKVSHG